MNYTIEIEASLYLKFRNEYYFLNNTMKYMYQHMGLFPNYKSIDDFHYVISQLDIKSFDLDISCCLNEIMDLDETFSNITITNILFYDFEINDYKNLIKFVNKFNNLKSINIKFINSTIDYNILEILFNVKCKVFSDNDVTMRHGFSKIIKFYKNHQDNEFYKHDLITSGAFDIDEPLYENNSDPSYSEFVKLFKEDICHRDSSDQLRFNFRNIEGITYELYIHESGKRIGGFGALLGLGAQDMMLMTPRPNFAMKYKN
jgi:hypothetical protein